MNAADRLRTVSLRRRVTLSSVAVLAIVLLLLGLVTDLLFRAQSRRGVDQLLRERAALAEQLARQGAGPRLLVARVETGAVKARLTTQRGEVFGSAEPVPVPFGQLGHRGPRQLGDNRVLQRRLPNNAELLLVADAAPVTGAQRLLRRLLVIVGVAALGIATLILIGTVRIALAPLDAMTAVANSITRGGRGRRLAPERTDTELGRTAKAFDDMLDALEGAEAHARASEERTRRFVADAAHELRTPIAGVQAAAEAVLQAGPAGPHHERERMHLLLVREARRAGRLVEDLLSLARIDAGLELHREPVDLLALAQVEADRIRLLAPDITVTVAGAPVVLPADPQRLAQVLVNLLDNARRHVPTGGQIAVEVSVPGPFAQLTVTDTGPGVPAPDRERIFDRLVRLDDARSRNARGHEAGELQGGPDNAYGRGNAGGSSSTSGAGLGLAIARGIARAHGGDLRCVEPPPGHQGARFLLTLPLTRLAGSGPSPRHDVTFRQ